MIRLSLIICLLLLLAGRLSAQVSMRDSSITMFLLNVSYGGYAPQADLGQRFGYLSLIGGDVGVKFKSGVFLLAGANFLFGEDVRETNIMDNVGFTNQLPANGVVLINSGWIDKDGDVVRPSLKARGFNVPVRVGYVFNKLRLPFNNPNAGVFVEGVATFIQHKIAPYGMNDVPYVNGAAAKGYDRLTRGWGAGGSVGYRYFSNSRYFNFYVAADLLHCFTQNQRYNFSTQSRDDRTRSDVLLGFRVGFSVPIYNQAPEKFYYY